MVPTTLNSTLAIVQKETSGAASYAFYSNGTADVSLSTDDLPASLPEELVAIHVGSYCTAVEPVASSLLSLVQRESTNRLISYDPNVRPTVEPDLDLWRSRFAEFAAAADLIKASDEDIETLSGKPFNPEIFAADALGLGAQLVCVTKGEGGAEAYSADGRQAQVKGPLHWLHAQGLIRSGKLTAADIDLDAMLEFATTAAAITCTRLGADLPGLADIEARLASR